MPSRKVILGGARHAESIVEEGSQFDYLCHPCRLFANAALRVFNEYCLEQPGKRSSHPP